MEFLFLLIPLFIGGTFVFVIGSLIVTAVSNLSRSPQERPARLVAKRGQAGMAHHHGVHHHRGATRYYATFEFEDRSREEFAVSGRDFGLLVEGDEGTLRSRGTWFQGFARDLSERGKSSDKPASWEV